MIGTILASMHIIAWLGFGGVVTGAAIFVAIAYPRFLYIAVVVALVAGASTIFYGKGVFDDHRLDTVRNEAATTAVLAKADKIRDAAEVTVQEQIDAAAAPHPEPSLIGRAVARVRPARRVSHDRYDRDSSPDR